MFPTRVMSKGLPPSVCLFLALGHGASAEESFDFQLTAAPRVRDGKALIVAEGAATLPPRSILKGVLTYRGAVRPVLLATWYEEVRNGRFEIPLDANFRGSLFPGTYAVTVTFDPTSRQYPEVLKAVHGALTAPLSRAVTVPVGAPEDAKAAEEGRRAEWSRAVASLAPLGEELREAFRKETRQPEPLAWKEWHAGWRRRVEEVQRLEANPGETQLLHFLAGYGLARDALVRLLLDVDAKCGAVLAASPPDADAAARVDQWLAYFLRSHDRAARGLRIPPANAPAAQGPLARLDALVRELEDWHARWREKDAAHAADAWPAWRDAWRGRLGLELLQLAEVRAEGIDEALAALTGRCADAAQAVDGAVSAAAGAPPVDQALAAARDALTQLGAKLAGGK